MKVQMALVSATAEHELTVVMSDMYVKIQYSGPCRARSLRSAGCRSCCICLSVLGVEAIAKHTSVTWYAMPLVFQPIPGTLALDRPQSLNLSEY